jgi:SPP1 family predicted phage head-tail adaptor
MIGEMRNRITVQTLSGGTDSGGGQVTSYGSDVTVWAKVENLSGTQSSFGDQIQDRANYRFTIRFLSAITAKHRISYNSKTFNIQHITSVDEGKEKYQIIQAEEGVAT